MKKVTLYLSILILCTACAKRKIKTAVEGWWQIDTIYYKKFDLSHCLTNKIMYLKFDDQTALPAARKYCGPYITNSYDEHADLNVVTSSLINDTIPFRLKMETKNELFNGMHKIIFYNDKPNQLLKMELFSDSLYVLCHKGLFNYESNIDLIHELEDITWINHPK